MILRVFISVFFNLKRNLQQKLSNFNGFGKNRTNIHTIINTIIYYLQYLHIKLI